MAVERVCQEGVKGSEGSDQAAGAAGITCPANQGFPSGAGAVQYRDRVE